MKIRRTGSGRLLRRLIGLTLAVCFVLGSCVTAWADAVSTYTVSVSSGYLSILKNGYVTSTYSRLANSAVTVATGEKGDLLVCYYNTSNKYVAVTLGSQEIVNFYGAIDTLKLDSSLDRPVVIGSTATVTRLEIGAPVKVSIWGKVKGGSVDAAATVVAAKGSTVSDLFFYHSKSRFYAHEGSTIDGTTLRSSENMGSYRYGDDSSSSSSNRSPSSSGSSSSGSNTLSSTSSGITLKSTAIYAIAGETLSDLRYELEYSVTAQNANGRLLNGSVNWVDRGSTQLWDSKSYRYRFKPYESGYDTVTGYVRIIVEDRDNDDKDRITLDINGPIHTGYDNKRLSYFLTKLEDRVEAYNEDGKRINGKVKWNGSNRRVTETETFKFTFTPNNPKYQTVTGEMQIVVE